MIDSFEYHYYTIQAFKNQIIFVIFFDKSLVFARNKMYIPYFRRNNYHICFSDKTIKKFAE